MKGVFPISNLYDLPVLAPGDYFVLEKEGPSLNRTDSAQYLILDDDKTPLLTAECSFSAGKLHSVVLATADVYRPVAKITRLNDDTFAVDIGGSVGTIEKTHGWQFRDSEGYVKLGIIRVDQKPTSPLVNFLSIVVSLHPVQDYPATIYYFWQHGLDDSFATYFSDLNNLEIKTVESSLTPYICIFLVLVTQLSANRSA